MMHITTALRLFSLSAVLLLCGSVVGTAAKKRTKKTHKKEAASSLSGNELPGLLNNQVRLKLTDGTLIPVDDAWESGQGIWYRQGGVNHLVSHDRVKAIERGSNKTVAELVVEKAAEVAPTPAAALDGPAWIYLKGGAFFEADSAAESASGVWYRRGPLSVFIERSRIDRVEREDPESVAKSNSSLNKELRWSTGNQKIDSLIKLNGTKYGVDPYLIFCVMEQESHFNTRALSPKGASGLMQLMPGTGARFGVRRPTDPGQNIAGGTRYLKQLMNQFNGRVDLVLASYNAGEGAVIKFGHKVPPYRETREYVKRISYRYRRAKALVGPVAGTATSAGRT